MVRPRYSQSSSTYELYMLGWLLLLRPCSPAGRGRRWRRRSWSHQAARPLVSHSHLPPRSPQYSAPTQISQAFPVQPSQHSQLPQLHKPFPSCMCSSGEQLQGSVD
ncbi:unnamed protein product [Pleuronectes platessa]|uniref:Uncharacterized protein n=1 Tax=Pleuronectes platessa TaxID=8262 RepID=A0A9N7VBV9_PLEPL|nr:unnamed protein product [Pleuronectes platessa]